MTERSQELQRQREAVKARLAAVGDMRQGSLVERYRRCGKANCHCAEKGAKGHGPSWSLTRAVRGKTVTRIIPLHAMKRTREQVAEFQKFRVLARELVEVNEQLCETQIRAGTEVAGDAAKKGGSKRSSKRRSSPKSRR